MSDELALKIPIIADTSGMSKAMDDMKSKVSSSMSQMKDAMGAVGLMTAGYLAGAVSSAIKAQESTDALTSKLKNQGDTASQATDGINAFTSGVTKMSIYSKGDAKAALDTLITRHVSLKEAMKDQAGITELAAAKNISLTDAANQLANAENGKMGGLVKLGVVTKEEVKNGISMEEVNKRLNTSYAGLSEGKMKTLPGQITLMHQSFAGFTTSIGLLLLPTITKLGSIFGNVADYITKIDAPTKKVIAGVLVATAVFGTLVGGLGVVQKVMGVLGPTLKGVSLAIDGLALPIVAVIAVIALFTVAYTKNFGGFKTFINGIIASVLVDLNSLASWFKSIWPTILTIFNTVLTGMKVVWETILKPILLLIVDAMSVVIDWVKSNWHIIQDVFKVTFDAVTVLWNTILKPVLAFIITGLQGVVTWVSKNWPLIKDTITTVFNAIKTVIEVAIGVITTIIKAGLEIIKPIWQLAWNVIKNVIGPIFTFIKDAVTTVMKVIGDLLKAGMDLVNGHWKATWTDLCNAAKEVFTGMKKIVNDEISIIAGVFKGVATTAISWGKGMINGIISGMTGAIKDIEKAVGSVVNAVTSKFKELFGIHSPSKVMQSIGGFLTSGLIKGLSASQIGEHVSGLISGMKGDFAEVKDFFNNVGTSGGGMTASVVGQIKQAMSMLNIPMSYLPGLETIANKESGGSTSVKNLWDSNAQAGHPSEGLFQMIPSTFAANAVSGHNNIDNGLDNALSAIRYMISQYGSISNVPGLVSMASGGAYKGYETGTLSADRGIHMFGEKGPEIGWSNTGDGVLNNTNTKALLNIPGVLQNLTDSINKIAINNGNGTTSNGSSSIIAQTFLDSKVIAQTITPQLDMTQGKHLKITQRRNGL